MSFLDKIYDNWTRLAMWVADHPKTAIIIAVIWNGGVIWLALRFCARC